MGHWLILRYDDVIPSFLCNKLGFQPIMFIAALIVFKFDDHSQTRERK